MSVIVWYLALRGWGQVDSGLGCRRVKSLTEEVVGGVGSELVCLHLKKKL